jgi:hypothetical protein
MENEDSYMEEVARRGRNQRLQEDLPAINELKDRRIIKAKSSSLSVKRIVTSIIWIIKEGWKIAAAILAMYIYYKIFG